jgi:hypothetical protein
MKVVIDYKRKDIARQIAVHIPQNATLFGLILSTEDDEGGDRRLHALVQVQNRFYSLYGGSLRPFKEAIEIVDNDKLLANTRNVLSDFNLQ